MRTGRDICVGLGLWLVACSGGDGNGDSDAGTGVSSGGINPTQPTTESGEDDGGDGSIKLDTENADGTGNGAEGAGGAGCEKVDFLFVIDSSASMEDEQSNLLGSFPGFITAIEDTLDLTDFHMMVVDAGSVVGGGCDGTLGAGRTTSASGANCGLAGSTRYATQDQADLGAAFSCMGARGFAGPGDEQTMDALVAAIGPLNADGGCNSGFLRDDAILVVTIITDEEDSPSDTVAIPPLDGSCAPADADPNSSGNPDTWVAAVVAAKAGNEAAAVVLSLLGDCDLGGSCQGIVLDTANPAAPVTGAEPAPRIRQFTESFGFGSVGPVCAADYTPFFLDAVSVIESACDDFVPPG